jgi:integrase
MKRLTKSKIDHAIARGRETKLWDEGTGLYLRVREGSHTGIFAVQYRSRKDRKQRSITIGRFGETIESRIDKRPVSLTVENARREAAYVKALDEGADRDAKAEAATLKVEAARWMTEQVEVHNRESTARLYGWMLTKHILPSLGSKRPTEITRDDCQRLHNAVGGKRNEKTGTAENARNANHCLSILGSLLGWLQVDPNPAAMTRKKGGNGKSIRRFIESRRTRFFTTEEQAAITKSMREMVADGSLSKVEAAFFDALKFSGCRPGEVLGLRWKDVGEGVIHLGLTKGGESDPRKGGLPIVPELRQVLDGLPRMDGDEDDRVFPIYKYGKVWRSIIRRAGVAEVTAKGPAVVYCLRHSFGYRGATTVPTATLSALMGHASLSTTQLYLHLVAGDENVQKHAKALAQAMRESGGVVH